MKTSFVDLLQRGAPDAPLIGTWTQIAAPEVVDILGTAGFAFTIVDAQHTSFSMQTVENLTRACEAAGIVPLVRVPDGLPHLILQACDLGAAAVVVPGVSTPEQARAAVAAARFGPAGERSACPMVRSGGHWIDDWAAHARRSDGETGIVALIETPQGVLNADAIAVVPGVVALLAGPFDLAVALGHGSDSTHAEVEAALQRLLDAARAVGIPLIVPIFAAAAADCRVVMQRWRERGVRLFTVGADKLFLADHVRRYVAALQR